MGSSSSSLTTWPEISLSWKQMRLGTGIELGKSLSLRNSKFWTLLTPFFFKSLPSEVYNLNFILCPYAAIKSWNHKHSLLDCTKWRVSSLMVGLWFLLFLIRSQAFPALVLQIFELNGCALVGHSLAQPCPLMDHTWTFLFLTPTVEWLLLPQAGCTRTNEFKMDEEEKQ